MHDAHSSSRMLHRLCVAGSVSTTALVVKADYGLPSTDPAMQLVGICLTDFAYSWHRLNAATVINALAKSWPHTIIISKIATSLDISYGQLVGQSGTFVLA